MPNIVEITDFHAPELDPYARLTQNQCSAAKGVIFLDMLSNMERISDHANNIVGYVADESEA